MLERWSPLRTLLLVLLLALQPALACARELPDFTPLVARHGKAVVNISATQPEERGRPGVLDENDPMFDFFRRILPLEPRPGRPEPEEEKSLGSGFIVSADGYILTNAHVVDGADEVIVRLSDKREFDARIIGSDTRSDIAVLKIDAAQLPVVVLGDAGRLGVGEWVAAIGSPFGFEQTVTVGVVSAKERSLPDENFVPFIQTDVAINPGNSGGPLFNLAGEVVGVNSQIYSRTGGFMGLSFAIPIDVALGVYEQLRQEGRVRRGRIGVTIQEVTRSLADGFGLGAPSGALVNQVEPGSPAERAGLRQGDLILRFNGRVLERSDALPRMVGALRPGMAARLGVVREGVEREVQVTVAELDEGPRHAVFRPARLESLPNPLGLQVAEPSAKQRRERKREGGLLVEQVFGAAARAQLQPGDWVLAAVKGGNHTPLRSVAQFERLVAGLGKGEVQVLLVSRGDVPAYISLRAGR